MQPSAGNHEVDSRHPRLSSQHRDLFAPEGRGAWSKETKPRDRRQRTREKGEGLKGEGEGYLF